MPPFSEIEGQLGSTEDISVLFDNPEPEGYFVYQKGAPAKRESLTPAEKKAKAMQKCGKQVLLDFDDLTGNPIFGTFHCGYEQECPLCFALRQERMQATLHIALHRGSLVMLKLPAGETALLRELGKEKYICIPGVEFDTVFADATHPSLTGRGKVITESDVETLPWDTLAVRAPGRKMSGNLGHGKPLPVALENPDAVEVHVLRREIDASGTDKDGSILNPTEEDFRQATDESILNTSELNPTDEKTLNEAKIARCDAVAAALQRMGFTEIRFKDAWRTKKLCLKEMNWSMSLDKVRRRNSFTLRQKAYQAAEKAF